MEKRRVKASLMAQTTEQSQPHRSLLPPPQITRWFQRVWFVVGFTHFEGCASSLNISKKLELRTKSLISERVCLWFLEDPIVLTLNPDLPFSSPWVSEPRVCDTPATSTEAGDAPRDSGGQAFRLGGNARGLDQ